MPEFPYKCVKLWPYEWTYNQIEKSGDADRDWLNKNVGLRWTTWDFFGPWSHPEHGLSTVYSFIDREQTVLFQLTRGNAEEE